VLVIKLMQPVSRDGARCTRGTAARQQLMSAEELCRQSAALIVVNRITVTRRRRPQSRRLSTCCLGRLQRRPYPRPPLSFCAIFLGDRPASTHWWIYLRLHDKRDHCDDCTVLSPFQLHLSWTVLAYCLVCIVLVAFDNILLKNFMMMMQPPR